MSKHIVLDVPEEDDPECALAELKDAVKQHVDRCPSPGCTVCPLIKALADSARLVDLEAMRRDDCQLTSIGYNAAIDEILGGK